MKPKKIKIRETCSNGNKPSSDNSGAWSMVRQRGTVAKLSKDEVNKRFGEKKKTGDCMPDQSFRKSHASWDGASKKVTEGSIELNNGVACSKDEGIKRRAWASSVETRGKLPEKYSEWPRNAKIIDSTFPDGKDLEMILKGIHYNHKAGKGEFLNVLSWFPGVCGEEPQGNTRNMKDICREEFAGITTFALAGEADQKTFETANKDKTLEWWQTAFMTAADSDCFSKEKTAKDTAKNVNTIDAKCKKQATGTSKDGKGAINQDTGKNYYARGNGPMPLEGPEEYTEFSKAMTGNEDTFGRNPSKMMEEGNTIGEFKGAPISAMPIAVALWRYTQYYHSFLPSMHDVIVGMWRPREHETKAGLKAGKFCSVASLVVAMTSLRTQKQSGKAYNWDTSVKSAK